MATIGIAGAPVRCPSARGGPDELTPSLNASIDAAVNQGFARVADFNGAEQAGVGPYPLNVISGRRVNTGIAFLDDGVRAGQNLATKGGFEVDRVLLEGPAPSA